MKMAHIRKTEEADRNNVALCIAAGLNMEKFYAADLKGDIAGVLAISDCTGRAARVDKPSLKKHFGFLKGMIGALVLKKEFEGQLEYPVTTQ